MPKSVKSRAIFFIGGYDPKSPDAFYTRMDREIARFTNLWGASVEQHPISPDGDDVTIRTFKSAGEGWATKTDLFFLTLDDIVLKDFEQPFVKRLWRSLVTSVDYIVSGTALAFLRHAWRFFLYFAYPVGMPIATFIISFAIAMMVATSAIPLAPIAAVLTFALAYYAITQFVWKRYFVLHLMDLWSFSRDFIRRKRDDIEIKLDYFADLVIDLAKSNSYDEIIMVGHSTGGALILDAAGRAVEKYPELHDGKATVSVLTIGSTALKIGLHPAAGWFRERVSNLFANPKVHWVEYQCLTDLINFHRTDPAKLMGLNLADDDDGNLRPSVRTISIKQMVSAETYKRIKRNFFRVHYQFVFGNTKKYHYDFMGICFGPALLADRAQHPNHFAQNLTPPEDNPQ